MAGARGARGARGVRRRGFRSVCATAWWPDSARIFPGAGPACFGGFLEGFSDFTTMAWAPAG